MEGGRGHKKDKGIWCLSGGVKKAGVVVVACLFLYIGSHILKLLSTPSKPVSGAPLVDLLLQPSPFQLQESCLVGASTLQVTYRRRIAFTLAHLHRHISRLAGTKGVVDAKWALVLRALVTELAPGVMSASTSTWDYSARLPDMGPAPPLPNRTRHVCPEVYFGNKYGHPFNQHGMEPEKCTYVPKFSSVLTAVLPAKSWPSDTINFVITNIRKFYNIPIIALVPKAATIDGKVKNVKILTHIDHTLSEAEVMNQAMQQVKTPYVFIGWWLTHFSNQSSLERLVRVMDELPHVEVVGGAARDHQGHWIHGCLQQRMADYQATYTMGYYYSKYECMYCDDLLTPFAATTELVSKVPFTAGLSGPAMYRDWFAKVREAGHLTMVCPDVMFFITNHVHMTRDQWMMVATRWALEKIYSYTGEVHNFSCDSVGISCKGALGIISSFLLPPCCRAIMEKELGFLMDYAETNKIEYELHSGSALGAVKMGGYLPWDFDHDLAFARHDYKKWLAMKGPYLENKKCYLTITVTDIYLTVYCPFFFLELYSHDNFTSRKYLPAEYRNIPTSIMYGGRWTVVMSNPGLYARNKLGMDDLKHGAHWRTLKVTSVGKAKGGYDNPGIWRRCKTPKHHSCQDRYPGDGNLPFLLPFLHP